MQNIETANIRLSFLGDISLNGEYASVAIQKKNPFQKVSYLLQDTTYLIGNLEAVVENPGKENFRKHTRLKIEPVSLELLLHLKPGLLTLANNHVYDQLYDGYLHTINFLKKHEIDYTGAVSIEENNASPSFIKTISGRRIAFLNYVHLSTNPRLPEDCKISVNIYDKAAIVKEIRRLRDEADDVILLLHWGTDDSRFPEPQQRKDAREFARAGADAIIGHHSHVLQGFENIGKTTVFYGLGNFAFAPMQQQKGYELSKRQRDTIILHWDIEKGAQGFHYDAVRLQGLEVLPATKTKIRKISRLIPVVSNGFVWPLYKFYLNYLYKIFFYFFGNGRNPFAQLKKINKSRLKRASKILGVKK
jgi:hypothetical protein